MNYHNVMVKAGRIEGPCICFECTWDTRPDDGLDIGLSIGLRHIRLSLGPLVLHSWWWIR